MSQDFPGGPPPCNAGSAGLTPDFGTKIPHTMEQLIPCATTTEALVLRSLRVATKT